MEKPEGWDDLQAFRAEVTLEIAANGTYGVPVGVFFERVKRAEAKAAGRIAQVQQAIAEDRLAEVLADLPSVEEQWLSVRTRSTQSEQ